MTRNEQGPITETDCSRLLDQIIACLDDLAKGARVADSQRYNLVCAHLQHGLDLLTRRDAN
ncbi:hypothetical protein [Sphingobium sp. HDIP04]|uniref:hypothetical protein n=1 Tax=Sphingobium sp. HDIP04 TaxID=428994 RepID=UPI000414781F|nr:hypothetical protein [Sphingobium sp. HDIP04]